MTFSELYVGQRFTKPGFPARVYVKWSAVHAKLRVPDGKKDGTPFPVNGDPEVIPAGNVYDPQSDFNVR